MTDDLEALQEQVLNRERNWISISLGTSRLDGKQELVFRSSPGQSTVIAVTELDLIELLTAISNQ